MLGTAGLPHILSRFYTVPTARAARRSVVWSIGLIGGFYLMTIVLGLRRGGDGRPGRRCGRRTRRGTRRFRCWPSIWAAAPGPTGGTVLFAVVAAVAFATILAVVAGHHAGLLGLRGPRPLRLAAAPAAPKPRSEVAVAGYAAVGIGAVAIALGLLART